MTHIKFIEEISGELTNNKLAVYCGAGISFNSGLPLVYQLLNYLYSTIQLDEQEKGKLFKSDIPFERVMETVLMESDIDEIKEIFATGTPNCNHLLLAKLAKINLLNTIYTTNFDVLIEKALEQEELAEGIHFKVYGTENELRNIDWNEAVIKIVKIHGCASEMDEMAITLGQLASNRYLDLRENLLSKIFDGDYTKSVLVLGYSCSDFDLVPIIANLQKRSSSVYFVEHNSETSFVEDVNIKASKNPFKNYLGLRYIGKTESIIESIAERFELSSLEINAPNLLLKGDGDWQINIDNWARKNYESSGGSFTHHIAGKLLYNIGELHNAISHMKEAVGKNHKQKNWIAFASNLDTLGMAYNKLGKYDYALDYLGKAISMQRKLNNIRNLASMLQSYANVLHNLKRDEEAIIFFKEAITITQILNDKSLECNVLGNISNSYIALGKLLLAKHSINKAMEISRDLGNKQAESSQLGITASSYMFSGQFQKAIEPLLAAIEIKKEIADFDELCKLYLNLATVYYHIDDSANAKDAIEKGLSLAKKINNQERINQFFNAIAIYTL